MEENKEMKPEVPAEEKKEAASETKPAAPLLTKEALKMVHVILGRGFIREHPEEWAILKNCLKDEMRPVPVENKALMTAIDGLQEARKVRREAYEARPKCAECKGPRGRLMYFVSPKGEIEVYHPGQCAGDKKLTPSIETAKFIAEQVVKEREESKNILRDTLQGIIAVTQVENKKPAEDRKDAQKIAAEKDALKVAGRIAANSMSSKNSNQTLIGKAMASAVIAKEKKIIKSYPNRKKPVGDFCFLASSTSKRNASGI